MVQSVNALIEFHRSMARESAMETMRGPLELADAARGAYWLHEARRVQLSDYALVLMLDTPLDASVVNSSARK